MSWSLRKKIECIFCNVLYFISIILNKTFRIHIQLLHYKNITSYAFLLVLKIVESLQCILKQLFTNICKP